MMAAQTRTRMMRPSVLIASMLLLALAWFAVVEGTRRLRDTAQASEVALDAARRSQQVSSLLGNDIKRGLLTSGQIIGDDEGGNADLVIPVHGSLGSGELIEWAQGESGKWHLCSLDFSSKDGQYITLLSDEKAPCERE
jgi:Cytochrome oxidase complex assembly protein 1